MEKYISKKEKASYGFAAVGSYMVAGITQSYLMYFFTDILIIPSAFVMMLMIVARAWDALNDPMMGVIVDRTSTKYGKMRPYVLVGSFLMLVTTIVLFMPLTGAPTMFKMIFAAVSYIIIQAAINSLGTIVIAASSAAFNIEVIAYDVFNSFSQACTTFVGQNYGAGKLDRCKKTLLLSIAEDTIATAVTIGLVLFSGRFLLSIFTSDPQVIELGYTRLLLIFSAYTFSMLYEIMSGYLRGFGISLVPALLTTIGVCGTRVFWIYVVFPSSPTFKTIMYAYPISLSLTAVLIFIALLAYHPSRRFKGAVSAE